MNPPSEDIKDMLVASAAGTGLTFGTDIHISHMPDTPDLCVAVYDTGGEPPEPHLVYNKPTAQVRVRGDRGGYEAAWSLAETIRDALNGVNNEVWNSTRYIGIWATGDILFIHYDDSKRPVLSVNFRIHRTNQ
jgi:hypothetical protein